MQECRQVVLRIHTILLQVSGYKDYHQVTKSNHQVSTYLQNNIVLKREEKFYSEMRRKMCDVMKMTLLILQPRLTTSMLLAQIHILLFLWWYKICPKRTLQGQKSELPSNLLFAGTKYFVLYFMFYAQQNDIKLDSRQVSLMIMKYAHQQVPTHHDFFIWKIQ